MLSFIHEKLLRNQLDMQVEDKTKK